VHAVGKGVGIRQFFGVAPQHSSSTEPTEEVINKLQQQIMEDLSKRMQHDFEEQSQQMR